jgi:hypothetical protein
LGVFVYANLDISEIFTLVLIVGVKLIFDMLIKKQVLKID